MIGRHYITTVTDTLTLIRGNHNVKFGGNYRDTQGRDRSLDGAGTGGYLGLPRYAIGVATGDPIASVLSTSTIPGCSSRPWPGRRIVRAADWAAHGSPTGGVVDPATLQASSSKMREN